MARRPDIRAWRPSVDGVAEVFHAQFTDFAYPMHAHGTWTLLIVDDGMVRYDLHRHEHGARSDLVTLLPPHVPHNGASATALGFRKRVVYLHPSLLSEGLIGMAVDHPELDDLVLRHRVHQLHTALTLPGEELEAESRLALIRERLKQHLRRKITPPAVRLDRRLAHQLRALLDARIPQGMTLREAAAILHSHPAHLVRTFSREFGMPPHQYLTTRRVDLARGRLLAGQQPPDVATATGFYDQAHLTRHFKRIVGISPGRYARTAPVRAAASTNAVGDPGLRTGRGSTRR